MTEKYKIMIVAGESSGDTHAASLVRALREKSPVADFKFFGATGIKMREAGVETVLQADELAIVGLPEIARALPMFWNAFKKLKQAAIERKPDAVILVDFPDFNMKLAKTLKKAGLQIIYYISPQLWAWRKYRVKTIEKYVDLLLTILPFEKDWYQNRGVSHVEYVGNPLAGEVAARYGREGFCAKHKLDPNKKIVAFLPGSRHKEIVRILPLMIETALLMAEKNSNLQFIIALGSTRYLAEAEAEIRQAGKKNPKLLEILITVCGETLEALKAADAAAVKSGTATLETAIIGTPLAIVYKSSALNYKLLRPLVSVPHFGLVNLVAGERLAKEFIQDDFTPSVLTTELFGLLAPETNRRMRQKLLEVADSLSGGASERAAEAILNKINFNR
ncbi:MAG: lipid-A-disaccharide synthase [Pyrinomonadaceae bacterium]